MGNRSKRRDRPAADKVLLSEEEEKRLEELRESIIASQLESPENFAEAYRLIDGISFD